MTTHTRFSYSRAVLATAAVGVLFVATLTAEDVKKVTHNQAAANAVTKPAPAYPTVARQLKIEGNVELTAFIAEDGSVERVETVSGNPILVRAAGDALRRWKFTPFKEDGKAVKAQAVMTFNFKL